MGSRSRSSKLLLFRRRQSRLFLDGNQLDFKNQQFIWFDPRAAAIAVGKIAGNKELPFRSDRHELQSFRPTLNDPGDREGCGLVAFVRAIEFVAVDEGAAII